MCAVRCLFKILLLEYRNLNFLLRISHNHIILCCLPPFCLTF
uniref:Uncharacterized protein n=1 Tax=Anguilla anguilla TaxID=7936 RepID=A0A0E9SXX6_ANGAN